MRWIVALLLTSLLGGLVHAQRASFSPSSPADSILREVAKKLSGLKTLKYLGKRELSYASEHYRNISEWDLYCDFTSADSLACFKYQVEDAAWIRIFNGTEKFELEKKTYTLYLDDKPQEGDFTSLSFLNNSLITLRNMLPLIIDDPSVTKTVSDTLVDGASLISITLKTGNRTFRNKGDGFDTARKNIISSIRSCWKGKVGCRSS